MQISKTFGLLFATPLFALILIPTRATWQGQNGGF